MIPYESHLIQIDFKIYLKEKSFFNPYSYGFFLWIEKMHCLGQGHLNPSKNLFFLKDSENINQNQKSHLNLNFSDGFRKCIPYQKAIWIWIFQMDSELVFLTKKLSESIWIWIFQMDSETVFLAKRPSESIWIWIFQMDWENVYLSKKVTWIHLTLKFFHGYRKEVLSFETTTTNVGGFDRSCFLLNDHLNPI